MHSINTSPKINKEFLLNALDAVSDLGMTIYDENGKILYYNEPSSKHDGIRIEDALGKSAMDIYEHQTNSTAMDVLRSGKSVLDNTIIYNNKNGKVNHCIGSSYPIKKDDEMVGAFSIIRFNDSSMALVQRIQELQSLLSTKDGGFSNGTSYTLNDIAGSSERIRSSVEFAKNAARSFSNILIYGETGTGKELFAQGMHNASLRSNHPFVAINCSAIPDTLLESMFFGTTKGAFTGAKDAPGIFENAGKGTVLLDEINSMPLSLQSKLLRVLQEKVITRLGSSKIIPVECSVISTTNVDPLECVERGTLREDLYYRLSVITLNIPPLRERKTDIIELSQGFLDKSTKIYGHKNISLDPSTREILLKHSWPGNVRELQHVIEGMVALMSFDEDVIYPHHLPAHLRDDADSSRKGTSAILDSVEAENESYENLKDKLDDYERNAIVHVLEKNNNNLSRTAKEIGYSRSNLQYRMKKLGISE